MNYMGAGLEHLRNITHITFGGGKLWENSLSPSEHVDESMYCQI